jgi:hypothetical protein
MALEVKVFGLDRDRAFVIIGREMARPLALASHIIANVTLSIIRHHLDSIPMINYNSTNPCCSHFRTSERKYTETSMV